MAQDAYLKEISNLRGVERTLLLPLWGRAVFGRLYPEILEDKEAMGIVAELTRPQLPSSMGGWEQRAKSSMEPANLRQEQKLSQNEASYRTFLDCGFGEIEKALGEYGGLSYLVRGRKIDNVVKHFIAGHPRATIVNIGAGLDTTFSRLDNGAIHWYDVDLDEVIALRQKIIPARPRSICIAKSAFDHSWFKDVRFQEKDGILFVAGGVFFYFAEEKVRELCIALAKNFPAGELYFDGQTKMALKISNRMVKKAGNKEATMYFSVNDPKIFNSWSPLLRLMAAEPYFQNIKRDRRWKMSTWVSMLFCDLLKMVSFYHLKFAS
jgi:O-methyltransferase involved in polyketide biosynthesis